MSRVLRIGPGKKVRIIDGQGGTGIFQVIKSSKKEVQLSPEQTWRVPPPEPRLHLALGWQKSTRRAWLLEKAVEMGAWNLVFWTGDTSQGHMDRASLSNWHKRLLAAAKQSSNPWIPGMVFMSRGLGELIDYARNITGKIMLWEGETGLDLLEFYRQSASKEKIAVIGPEGGLKPQETEQLSQAGFCPVSAGSRILRWETAALTVLCLDMLYREQG